jgi:hypothetical protein
VTLSVVDIFRGDDLTPEQERLRAAMFGEGDPVAEFLAAVIGRPAWMADAACRGHGNTVNFFPKKGERAWSAISLCIECPVRAECDAYSSGFGSELDGVWGGRSAADRRAGRPFAG